MDGVPAGISREWEGQRDVDRGALYYSKEIPHCCLCFEMASPW